MDPCWSCVYLSTGSVRYLHLNSGGTEALSLSLSVCAQQHLQGSFLIAWLRQSEDVMTAVYLQTLWHPFNHTQTPFLPQELIKLWQISLLQLQQTYVQAGKPHQILLMLVHKDFEGDCNDHRQSDITFGYTVYKGNLRCHWGFSSLLRAPLSGRFLLWHTISSDFLNGIELRLQWFSVTYFSVFISSVSRLISLLRWRSLFSSSLDVKMLHWTQTKGIQSVIKHPALLVSL